jgi:hypothetical protein
MPLWLPWAHANLYSTGCNARRGERTRYRARSLAHHLKMATVPVLDPLSASIQQKVH